jgi:toxin ParE1/3/4
MARYRLSDPAKADIVAILRRSEDLHGRQARIRYRALLTAAIRRVAEEPEGALTSDRADLLPGIRSFHLRHSRKESRESRVASPVHVVIYRVLHPGKVEIVRVLHERMDAHLHIGVGVSDGES